MPLLSERVFDSSFDCRTKCYFLLHGRRGPKTEYETHASESNRIYQRAAISKLQGLQDTEILKLPTITPSALSGGSSQLVIIKRIEINECRSDAVVLLRSVSTHMLFQPLLFNRYEEISSRLKLLLGFRAALVGAAIGVVPTHGLIISGRDFKRTRISLPLWIPKSRGVMHDINELQNKPSPRSFYALIVGFVNFEQNASHAQPRKIT